jgi:hypothetical protein
MPTIVAYHQIKDAKHWLSSSKREELFGPLGVTNIRTFVDPQDPTRAAVMMDVPDMDAVMSAMKTEKARRATACGGRCCDRNTQRRHPDRLIGSLGVVEAPSNSWPRLTPGKW